jgi:uncharacterized repeat protein (TIGR03803 family)
VIAYILALSKILRKAVPNFTCRMSVVLLCGTSAWTQATEAVLFNFPSYTWNSDRLVVDSQGNLYGVTNTRVNKSQTGYVYRLKRGPLGIWTLKNLHEFTGGSDGGFPNGDLIFDSVGNLYGTAQSGGFGSGVVFELSPGPNDTWNETVLYAFNGASDGQLPASGLTFDAASNLYGTTLAGGASGHGVVYELSPDNKGGWTEKIGYSFTDGADGAGPSGKVILDPAGNLYGGTLWGGAASSSCGTGCGVVYKLTPQSVGQWTDQTLYSFCTLLNCADGSRASGALVLDAAGNLYGVTGEGGDLTDCALLLGCGVAFELTPGKGSWSETVLHTFTDGSDGGGLGPLLFNNAGELYGSAYRGGTQNGGDVFRLTPGSNGAWTFEVVYDFCSAANCADGADPGNLAMDAEGNVYGITGAGGTLSHGTAYELNYKKATTNTMTSSSNPAWKGQPIELTATLTSKAGSPPDGETVTFYNATKALGHGVLSGGSTSLLSSSLSVGTHSLAAVYNGDANFMPSTSTILRQVINATVQTATSVSSSANPSTLGQSVTFTATVNSTEPVPDGGLVTFYLGTSEIGTGTTQNGEATFSTSLLPVGTRKITAIYAGEQMYASSRGTLQQIVEK